ncbi:winged helix-turn-helix transcriptional regulator [Belliella marina]|uniref:Winged helix-turn-helix transcriptional regulator n=1 Tax=Belliella marina TaxID=1644146 RepID=A0ABW4VIP5_9BACT
MVKLVSSTKNGLVNRCLNDNPVRIDYEITDYCRSFQPIIDLMIEWGKRHRE